MRQKKHGHMLQRFAHDNQGGYILIIAILLLSAVISVIAIRTSLSSLNTLETSELEVDYTEVSAEGEGCIEDALLRLNWDNAYTGATYSLGGVQCTVGDYFWWSW